MRSSWLLLLSAATLLPAACATAPEPATAAAIETQQLELLDPARNRRIPVLIYGAAARPRPLAVISHGYGGRNSAYSFLAHDLVRRGYLVASVQHELPGDAEIATGGDNLAARRRPNWQAGVDNIRHAAAELRRRGLATSAPLVLVGHSNGGDMAMLMAELHPREVAAAFSLDNRRQPLPRTASPRICSVRSSDQPADPGVLPTPEEQSRHTIRIAAAPVIHNDMWDGATPEQKAAMLALLDACLQGLPTRR